ncbi:hypothetical protein FSP39_024144 [Pinctada imbricata]|uniref:Fringe-like glycosyltransferase domain-containing protein n=1 Tax=Pinctada imbricata TaxID=66713 RepID=A0AA89BS26_PINIB|nr:hypothetical protein FSP39_024144 [Pinctada imbricata]
MAREYDHFMESGKRWFCHVDDDTYLNFPQLVQTLRKYDHEKKFYLGKPSLRYPIETIERPTNQKVVFWFATGGAGFCLSKGLALEMMPHAGGGRFVKSGDAIRLPDDCTIGYIVNYLLKVDLTRVNNFHSHLEALWRVNDPENQLTFSYNGDNSISIKGFSAEEDPTRFRSLHCKLHPETSGHLINTGCPKNYFRQSICCKFEKEYDHFMKTSKRWFCHVDDDNYLNIDNLLKTLRKYDHNSLWYLGRKSKEFAHPPPERPKLKHIRFVFATTGAGMCLSRALANKLFKFMGNGRFVFTGNVIAMPDDCTLGYIVNHLLKLNLTYIKDFHSHLEQMKDLKNPEQSITIGYFKDNVINIDGFSKKDDPTRTKRQTLLPEKKGGDLQQHTVVAPTAKPQNTHCKTQSRRAQNEIQMVQGTPNHTETSNTND